MSGESTAMDIWAQLARTERNARPAPTVAEPEAMSAPGHIPYVKPMRVSEAEEPNSGGWEATTVLSAFLIVSSCRNDRQGEVSEMSRYALTKRHKSKIPLGPISRILTPNSLNHRPIRVGVMMMIKAMMKMFINPSALEVSHARLTDSDTQVGGKRVCDYLPNSQLILSA